MVARSWTPGSAIGPPEGLAWKTGACVRVLSQWGRSKVGKYTRHIREALAKVQAAIQNLSLDGLREAVLDAKSVLE